MSDTHKPLNFLEQIVEEDLKNGLPQHKLRFRFPPEPNGYLHIGHTKAIGISFGLGEKYNAPVNLRFDDTNPTKEDQEYVDAIKEDIDWLGYKWDKEVYSSDYFEQLYLWALQMIKDGKAYVDSQSSETMAAQKGTPTQPGEDSPFRTRSVDENLILFNKMKAGEFKAGTHVLRAKIDMKHANMLMRDPLMYRILHADHHRTGSTWCLYPMYDWTHGESDYLEQVSHSLCSLEFKPHRELYDWFKNNVYTYSKNTLPLVPKQREFARLNLSYTIMSKRKLLKLVEDNIVRGWDDPRMPTISGLRRRGYTPSSIRNFIDKVGVAKRDNIIDVSLLEFCVREDLNKKAARIMAVLEPVKLIIQNYPEDQVEWLEADNNPEEENAGTHKVPFSRTLYIEREDFKEEANSKYFRLTIGKEVRLKSAFIIKGESVVKDANGNVLEIHCSYDPKSLSGSGSPESLRKVKGTLHWVSVAHAIEVEVREYDRLFSHEDPDNQTENFMTFVNPESLKVKKAFMEPHIKNATIGQQFQFQRLGYFNVDKDSSDTQLVFNKTVGLRDTWAKQAPKATQPQTSSKPAQHSQRKPIDVIKQLGKKYTNLPEEKQQKVRAEILTLAKVVSYEDLEPLFGTAAKKTGTRIAVVLVLGVMIENGQEKNNQIEAFITSVKADNNPLLSSEAHQI
jgi:glutaminyl-tRNA synthetase